MSKATKTVIPAKAGIQKTNGLVPRLRFSEFREAGAWIKIKLRDLGKLISGLTYSPEDVVEEGLLVLRSSNVQDGNIVLNDNVFVRSDIRGANLSKPGDILICVRNGSKPLIGKNALIPDGLPLCTHGAFMTVFKSKYPEFTYQLFQTTSYKKQVAADLGATINSINGNNLKKYEFFIPGSEGEQQKIADCLSSLDALIAAQADKIEALRTHKKGLMQKLFPREGETVPRLRFSEFRDAGEWKIRELGSLATKVGSGITPRGGEKNYKTVGRPFIRSQNVGWGELLLDDVAFINEETHKSFDSTEIKDLDVLLNISGASIGRSAIADSHIAAGNVNQHVCIIRVKQDELNPILLNQFLLSERGQSQIDSFQAGGNRQGLNFGQIRSFKVQLPPSEAEQQKIADCLSHLDALIAAHTEKFDALKTHKKGLMQQLFPNPEVVSI